jgi:hypothetical protein
VKSSALLCVCLFQAVVLLYVLVDVVLVLLLAEGLYICVLFNYNSGLSCCSMHDKANFCRHSDFFNVYFFHVKRARGPLSNVFSMRM